MRKIELALSDGGDHNVWKGLVKVDGELFKVNLFVGSFTKPWGAMLMQGAWTDCTPGNPLTTAIERAYQEWILCQHLTRDQLDDLLNLSMKKPEILDELIASFEKEEEDEPTII